jgi:hypothetical protein
MNLHKLQYKLVVGATTLALLLPLTLGPDVALAKGSKPNRERFYGIIQSKPAGLQGTWQIGGRTVTTSRGTEFDQLEGALVVGACAKVDIRNGKVHEIDSEPMRNCR